MTPLSTTLPPAGLNEIGPFKWEREKLSLKSEILPLESEKLSLESEKSY